MVYVLGITALSIAVSFLADSIAYPRARLSRPFSAYALHLATFSLVVCLIITLTGRLYFSIILSLALIATLAIVSNAKYKALGEPFVFTDLSLFSQAVAHPRLYLPFLGEGVLLLLIGAGLAIFAGFVVESSISLGFRVVACAACFFCVGFCMLIVRRIPLRLEPLADQGSCGFLASFTAYLVKGCGRETFRLFEAAIRGGRYVAGRPAVTPDIVIIQSESYFDARRLGPFVSDHPYAHFDRARKEAFAQGALSVPAWGANTMRSEFALLTGVSAANLGLARFYPYWYIKQSCASLAGWLKRGGYRTVALHPYYADFFGRARVFKLLHFDQFADIRSFERASRIGPYVSDEAVADAVIAALDEELLDPTLIFAITMENHGPLHLEQVAPGEFAGRHALGDDARFRDLTAYLRHVENADRMIAKLMQALRSRERPAILCFYGDHVPAMRGLFGVLGIAPQDSDYFIWRNFGTDTGRREDTRVHDLGRAIQCAMGNTDAHNETNEAR